jgi:replication factor C subunit 3/5
MSATDSASVPVPTAKANLIGGKELLPWVEKYRPSSLQQLVAHEDIIRTIERMMEKRQLPHMLLHGPPGTGKTSTITALAKTMYKEKYKSMTLELNASDARGIDVVRDQIKTFVSVKQLFGSSGGAADGQPKLVILDEADNMTNVAQFALRRMIEQYAPNARFILICNFSSRIIPALQSRCTKLRFGPLTNEQISGRVRYVADCEKVEVTPDGVEAIVQVGGGDMRRVLNVFQTTSMGHSIVDANAIYASTGVPHPQDIDHFLKTLLNSSIAFATSVKTLQEMLQSKGYALDDFLQLMHERLIVQDMPVPQRIKLNTLLADIDWRLKQGCNEQVQVAGIVGAFHEARAETAR